MPPKSNNGPLRSARSAEGRRKRSTRWVRGRKVSPRDEGDLSPHERLRPVAVQRFLQQKVEMHLKGDATAKGIFVSVNHSGVPAQLPIPVRIWLEDEADSKNVQEALRELLKEAGFVVARAYPPQAGSWRRSFVYKLRRAGTSKDLRRRLDKVERGIELQLLTKNQAEVDQAQGDAVAKLLNSLENTPTALIQIGSILLVKVDGVPCVRNLTQDEIALLDSNPSLLDSPESALSALNDAVEPLRDPRRILARDVDSEESSASE